jgi:hypothetical protein
MTNGAAPGSARKPTRLSFNSFVEEGSEKTTSIETMDRPR